MIRRIRHTRSKYLSPTRVIRSGTGKKGQLIIGHIKALEDIKAGMKREMGPLTKRHTRGQWVFLEDRPKG